ncbi:MAG: D-alanine--D-alanine ligase [Clostridiales Family XIII bacterium]|jgi:D-alanine-D-alanine ligase|nr:D-alanine--D-alanine ligase [Clostridiales Family XIII bacterium]
MIRLGLIFGGRSGEHEISILSAASIAGALDRSKYEVIPIGIDKNGKWRKVTADMNGITSLDNPRLPKLIPQSEPISFDEVQRTIDFAFIILHGPYGEDGTIQGLFEMMDKPYAGPGVVSSAVSMDKIFTKDIWIRAGLPVCKHVFFTAFDYKTDGEAQIDLIEKSLPYPVFVKPANLGSSVGITKAANHGELVLAVEKALKYDRRIIVEEGIDGRELEVAVLGNEVPETGAIGEIMPENEFYDYEAKYSSSDTKLSIPAENVPADIEEKIYDIVKRAYRAVDGEGFSRVDTFYVEETGEVFLNEINTLPGFTNFSMFPSLWKAKGVEYSDLVERIIDLGFERYNAKNNR